MSRWKRTTCGICASSDALQRSHIVPESAYGPSYDAKHKLVAFDPLNPTKHWKVQKGVREPLLCRVCEQFLNEHYEKRFKELWFDERPLDILDARDDALLSVPEPERFKLFHLSVLLRADLAAGAQWRSVNLAPSHRARLIEMVRSRDAGEPHEFPIACCAIRRSATDRSIWWDLVAPPLAAELFGVRQYQFTFGGCSWWYFDTLHPVPEILNIALRTDGTLPVIKRDWKPIEFYSQQAKLD